ncbi:MAG: hypothetical protein HZA24_01120 [Nitrospirae bacterium]|nr:hypothetical protein [Nitrospirota bacterium]
MTRSRDKTRHPVLRSAAIATLILAAGAWAYAEFVYSPVIFGLRDDFVQAVPNQTVPEGLTSLSAESCGACHREIYDEWRTSIHSQAYVDPYFQAYWQKDGHIWICANCHTPLQNQQPLIVTGLKGDKIQHPLTEPNPMFDPALQREGITCAGCHVRDGVVYGPYADSQAPHPTAYDPRYRTTEICYWCHQVPSGPFQFYNGGPCATFLEFEDGPYARQGFTCQTCHMPPVTRPAAHGGPERDTRRHLWRGGHFPDMLNQALEVKLSGPDGGFQAGDDATFGLRLTNGGAGHKIPTGDPDRHFTITFEEMQDGKVVESKRHTIGRWLIWKPVIIELYENRIPPTEFRDYRYTAQTGPGRQLRVTVTYHIVTERAKGRLIRKYDLPPDTVDHFTLFEQTVDLGAPDAAANAAARPDTAS